MNLDEATQLIQTQMDRMAEVYKKPVFDEWAVLFILERRGRILSYHGPRRDDFQRSFLEDVKALGPELLSGRQNIGDFEFSTEGAGTGFDAFIVLGRGLFLICNNTTQSIAGITRNPLWLSAQVPFVELSDRFRADPLVHAP